MLEIEFYLRDHDFIPLDKLLKINSLVDSGGDAHQHIDAGVVKVNGETELRRRRKLYSGDEIHFKGYRIAIRKG